MKNNRLFVDVYKHVYTDKYKAKKSSFIYYKNILKKNFFECKIKTYDIKKLTTLNSGTGLECLVMQSLNTKNNFFLDISGIAIKNLNHHIKKKK